MSVKTTKRAGGEKRGSSYDKRARLSALSMRDGFGPTLAVTLPARRRVKGAWIQEPRDYPFKRFHTCAHCGIEVSCDPMEREDPEIRAEQDRIDPNGGYVLDNLQLSCRRCNLLRSDKGATWDERNSLTAA